jgi:hypothetical protein
LANVPDCGAVPWIVKVTLAPAGKAVMVLVTLLPLTLTAPQTAPIVGMPQIPLTPVIVAGTLSLNVEPFAPSGPALLTVTV